MLMLTRCATLRDSPGNQRPSKRLVFYIALRPQPLLINPRDEPPAIGSPAAAGRRCPPRLPLPALRQGTRLSPACRGCPPLQPTLGPRFRPQLGAVYSLVLATARRDARVPGEAQHCLAAAL